MTRRVGVVRATSVAVVVAISMIATACGGGESNAAPDLAPVASDDAVTYDYTIPLGAGEAIDRGEPLDILPEELDARVGESIRIVNNDDRGHNVGPFFVGSHETMSQQFSSPGDFVGICTVHPSGQFILHVTA